MGGGCERYLGAVLAELALEGFADEGLEVGAAYRGEVKVSLCVFGEGFEKAVVVVGEGEDRPDGDEVDGAGAGDALELAEAGAGLDVGEVDGREGGARDEDGEDAGVDEIACGLVDRADATVEGDAVEGTRLVVEEELV